MIGAEVDVQALQLPDLLIVPAAGVVDDARGVEPVGIFCCRSRVKLPPAFIEQHPGADTRAAVELRDQFGQLGIVARPRNGVGAGKFFVVVVLVMDAGDERGGDGQQAVVPAAVDHVLPDQHTEPVAVIVPAHGLDFDVLAQHVKAHVLHELKIKDHCLVRRRGVKPVRPVALIEHAVLVIRLAVEKQARRAVFVFSDAERAHGGVACHAVFSQCHVHIVERRRLRGPEPKRFRRNGKRAEALFICRAFRDRLPMQREPDDCAGGRGRLNLIKKLIGNEVRRIADCLDVIFRHPLIPDRLPDTALRGVPDAAAAAALLAARELRGFPVVSRLNGQFVVSCVDKRREVR